MKNFTSLIIIILLNTSCKTKFVSNNNPNFTKIKIDTLLSENLSCRAILIDKNKVWYAGNHGNYGFISLDSLPNFKGNIIKDNLDLEFRSIAQTENHIFILSISNPALLYRINKNTKEIKIVYQENHQKVFYDSMHFLNNNEGYAIGDPTENCPSIIKTINGGENWVKLPCENLPKFIEGEAFFATSNTNLTLIDNTIWMASGGKQSRIYKSTNKGETWETFQTPIVQGEAMTGIFTSHFYDKNIGFITGGNYEKPNQNFQNKAITKNGGKTWKLINDNEAFGYASCVQYLPNSGGKSVVVVANSGIFYLRKNSQSWIQLSDIKDLYTIKFINQTTAVAAGKNKILKITFQ